MMSANNDRIRLSLNDMLDYFNLIQKWQKSQLIEMKLNNMGFNLNTSFEESKDYLYVS